MTEGNINEQEPGYALTTPSWDQGYPVGPLVYRISDNTRSFWSLTSARQVLGYRPEDDSEIKYANDIQSVLTGEGARGGVGKVGP